MRSSFLAIAIALIAAPPLSAEPVNILRGMGVSDAVRCPESSLLYQAKRGQEAQVSKLTDLPPANAYFAVLRVENGCQVPVMAGYGYGVTNKQERTQPRR